MQKVLERVGMSKTRITNLHPQSDGMVVRYVKTVEEQVRKVVSVHQRDWKKRLPIFLLGYRASIHETTGSTPAGMVFGRELRLPCDLFFGAPSNKEQSTIDYVVDFADRLRGIHHYALQHLKVASDRMKARYDRLSSSTGFQEGEIIWLYRPTWTRGKLPKLQLSWEDPHKVIIRMNDLVYRIQRHPRTDDGGTPGETGAISWGYSGRAVLRREQCRKPGKLRGVRQPPFQ
jgi:hypothetical protein